VHDQASINTQVQRDSDTRLNQRSSQQVNRSDSNSGGLAQRVILRCSQCRQEKPAEEFAKAKDRTRGRVSSCKKCRRKWPELIAPIPMIGRRFSRLIVLSFAGRNKHTHRLYTCLCDCGKQTVVTGAILRNGKTRSCGCLHREQSSKNIRHAIAKATKHGESGVPEYCCWNAMLQRCRNPNNKFWHNYGGRGITVCERWSRYENFIADMGYRPSPQYSLDRIRNDGNYEPSNCRWATQKDQVNNQRKRGTLDQFSTEQLVSEIARREV
jgi:hypothetical protein